MNELFYEDLIQSYVDNPRFIQRPWLMQKIESAVSDPNCRFVLLTGEPGSGKTAFMASIARQHTDWPRYFIRRDSQTPLSSGDARSFLFAIGHQLATLYPNLFAPEKLEIAINQRIGELKEGGKATALTIKELQTSPFYTTSIKVMQDAKIVAGDLEGLSINRVVAEKRFLELENLQYLALLDPAEVLKTENPTAKIFIILDALDELRYYIGRDNILDWLASCPTLPSNVKFIITSRPDEMLNILKDRQQHWIKNESIDPKSTNVETDLKKYTNIFINEPDFKQLLTTHNIPREKFIDSAVQKSDGNFQYLTSLLRGIEEAITKQETTQLERLLKFQDVPSGLENLYSFFLQLIKNNLPKKTVEIPGDSPFTFTQADAWEELYQPILGVLSVAREPLNITQICGFAGFKGEKRHLQGAIERLTQFMDHLGENYRLYHATLAEFLTSEKTKKSNPQCYLDPTEWNRKIAAYYRGKAATWDEVDWNNADNYGLLHLSAHLYALRNVEINGARAYYPELGRLICKSWIAQKFIRFGSYANFLPDLELAANAAEDQETPDIAKLAGFAVARQTLRQIMLDIPIELLQVWVRFGETPRVLPLVENLGEVKGRAFDALLTVAQELLAEPLIENTDRLADKKTAVELLQQAILILPLLRSSSEKLKAFTGLTKLLASPSWSEEESYDDLLKKCKNLAESLTEPALRASCLSLMATVMGGKELYIQEAKDLIQSAQNTINTITFPSDRAFSLIYLLPALEKIDLEKVLPTVKEIIKDPNALLTSSSLGKHISLVLLTKWPATIEPRQTEDLLDMILDLEIKGDGAYGLFCGAAANLLLDMGKDPEALSMIEKARILSPLEGARVIMSIAQRIYTKNPDYVIDLLDEAGKYTDYSYHDLLVNRDMFTAGLAHSLASIGKWEKAICYIDTLQPNLYKSEAICELIALAGSILKSNFQLASIINQLTAQAEQEEPEKKAKIYANAAKELSKVDTASARIYATKAVQTSLSTLPEGDTDALRRLLSIAFQEEGNYDTALAIAKVMKWETSSLKTINNLTKIIPPTETVELNKCAVAILDVLKEKDIQLIDNVAKLAIEAAENLRQILPQAAEKICNSVISVIFNPKFRMSYQEVVKCLSFEADARSKFDRKTGLSHFNYSIDLAKDALNKNAQLSVGAMIEILENLRTLSETQPKDALPILLRAHALATFYPQPEDKSAIDTALAISIAPINQKEAFKIIQSQIQIVVDLSKSPPPALHLLRMITEFVGKHAGPNYLQTQSAEKIGQAILTVNKYNLTKANELMQQFIDVITAIQSQEDRAQALADLFENSSKAIQNSSIILPSVQDLALTKLLTLLDDELRAFVAEAAVKMFCELADIKSAKIVAQQMQETEKQRLLNKIEMAEEWFQVSELGKLTPMEQVFINDSMPTGGRFGIEGAILHCIKVEGTSAETLKILAESLAKGSGYFQTERVSLLDGRIRLLMPLARVVGGIHLMSEIVDEIEKADKLFLDAAAIVAQQ